MIIHTHIHINTHIYNNININPQIIILIDQPMAGPTGPPKRQLTKEEELTLLQKIVKEEWMPPGVPPLLDHVNDELTKLLSDEDTKVFTAVCDYIVQIFQ